MDGRICGRRRTEKAEFPKTVDDPLYLKDGAFIQICEPGEFSGQRKMERIELNLYPCATERRYQLYEDDGMTEK